MTRRQRLTLLAAILGSAGATIGGAILACALAGEAFAADQHSGGASHEAMLICAAPFAVSGAIGIANPGRLVRGASCPCGLLAGAPQASQPREV